MTNLAYLVGGFAAVWAIFFVYMWTLARRTGELQRQLESLQAQLDRNSGD